MPNPIREELRSDLHAATLGEGVACDYHERPKAISSTERMLVECIRLVDHPQLSDLPEGWMVDAARCSEHTVETIVEPTRGYEEALITVPITETNGVVSVDTPASDDIRVLDVSLATEGLRPMVLDQQLFAARESGDVGISRWNRVQAMLAGDSAAPFQNHIKHLIDKSPETPFD